MPSTATMKSHSQDVAALTFLIDRLSAFRAERIPGS